MNSDNFDINEHNNYQDYPDYQDYEYNEQDYMDDPCYEKYIDESQVPKTKQELFEENDIKYLSYIENIKNNVEKNTFSNKPEYFPKSLFQKTADHIKLDKCCKYMLISPLEIFYKLKYEKANKLSDSSETCVICMDDLYEIKDDSTFDEIKNINESFDYMFNVVLLDKCQDHFFHTECIAKLMGDNSCMKCPVCNKIYGILTGTQPPGTMHVHLDKNLKCKGYENFGTIVIQYSFPSGQGFTGTHRTAYLPNNEEGRKILGLFKVCFDRKLIFTVGTSVTSGQRNTTVWSGIHHKTHVTGGTSSFGYPDPTYFSRVQEEMASRGVTVDNIGENPENIAKKLVGPKP